MASAPGLGDARRVPLGSGLRRPDFAAHRHNPESFGRLRAAVTGAFTAAGVSPEMAEQSWYIFGTSVVSWLAAAEAPLRLGSSDPRFELFLDSLLRGLPAQEPGQRR